MSAEVQTIDYAAVLADLKARRAAIDALIAGIEAGGLVGQSVTIVPVPGALALVGAASIVSSGNVEVHSDSFFGMSVVEATKKYLSMKKRPAPTPEVVDALKRGGIPTGSSENFSNTVAAGLSRSYSMGGGIVRVQRGTWGLADWYPNKPRKSAAKSANGESESD